MGAYVLSGDFPDKDLVQRCRDGEEEAFSELYRRYRCRVLSAAYRILRDVQEAQDATQEIFLKVHRALPGWDPERSRLSTWLYRLASNHAVDRWRSQSRRRKTFSADQREFAMCWPLCAASRVETPTMCSNGRRPRAGFNIAWAYCRNRRGGYSSFATGTECGCTR